MVWLTVPFNFINIFGRVWWTVPWVWWTFPCTFIVVVEVGNPKTYFFSKLQRQKTEFVRSHGNFKSKLGKHCESKAISWNKELKPCHVQSKVIQYQYMSTSFLIIDKCTFKIILIYENHFQVRAHYNRLVRPPHPVKKNSISIIYYTMNQKSIYETSYHC